MANAAMEDFVRWSEGKLAKSRDQLEPLEFGRVHFGTRPFGGRWEDITLREIRRVKANIAELEGSFLNIQAECGQFNVVPRTSR